MALAYCARAIFKLGHLTPLRRRGLFAPGLVLSASGIADSHFGRPDANLDLPILFLAYMDANVNGKLFKPKFKAFRIGPLPAAVINAALGTELEVADVWVSKVAHQHIALDHPEDYPAVKANIIDIITSPTWVGQDPKHGGNFYLVRRVRQDGKDAILVAIGLGPSEHGTYRVRTAYAIGEDDILTRRLRGSLHPLYLK